MSARDEIIALLAELAELTVLDEGSQQSFRARAYENAMHSIKGQPGEVSALSESELCKIEGIGKSTAKKIREYFDSGRITKLDELRKKFPPELVHLSRIPGVGPKTLLLLRQELEVENIEDLRRVIAQGRVRELPRMSAKTEEKLGQAIERLGLSGANRRTPIAEAMPLARALIDAVGALPQVERVEYCGSLRRLSETIGDIDILAASRQPAPIMEAFVKLPQVSEVIVRGDTKSSVLTSSGLQVDLRVVEPQQFGAAVLYFTGSKAHNIKIRQRALERGWTLNEYGLTHLDTGEVIASRTEEEIYAALELASIPPSMREDTGEVEAAARRELPALPAETDLLGDLHVHTTLSGDGRSPIDDIVDRAAARGYRYMAITDHAENLPINGVSREELRAQHEQIARLQERHPQLRLLRGCELNIGPRGDLDYDLEFRLSLDWCVAAVHSHFDLSQAAQTERIIRAMQDPAVSVIGHLSGRMIGRRPGIELDIDAVLDAAADTGTAIELNSSLSRLDVAADVLRRSRGKNVVFVISTDAHHIDELTRMRWGVQQAARGWLDRQRIANTWQPDAFLAWASTKRRGSGAG